jgi:hypothetical protein
MIETRRAIQGVSYVLTNRHQYPPWFCPVLERQDSYYLLRCQAVVLEGSSYRVGELMPCPRCTPRLDEPRGQSRGPCSSRPTCCRYLNLQAARAAEEDHATQ